MPDTITGHHMEEGLSQDAILDMASALADRYRQAQAPGKGPGGMAIKPARDLAGHDLERLSDWLAEAHRRLREGDRSDDVPSSISEWILDNFYIIRQAVRQIAEDLPEGYYRRLPLLTAGPLAGLPRIYGIARELLTSQHYHLHLDVIAPVLIALQEQVPLTMGELWAVPILLRYALVEALAHTLADVLAPSDRPDLPPLIAAGAPEGEAHGGTLATRNGDAASAVANIVPGLRAIADTDWKTFFEEISAHEAILRQDPAGLYARMDFDTRDAYRKQVERLALAAGWDERQVATAAVTQAETAAQAADSVETAGHIGTYLIGPRREALERMLSYRPGAAERLGRWARRQAAPLYLGAIGLVALALYALAGAVASLSAGVPWYQTLSPGALIIAILAFAPPALIAASSLVDRVITEFSAPNRLPKLEFEDAIPAEYQTLVAVPSLISRNSDVDNLIKQLEVHYLSNPQRGLCFALLSDYGDADSETRPEDADLLSYALQAIETLNARYARTNGDGVAAQPVRRFFLLHRRRLWNEAQGVWMGWERKRGKLHELNQFLRGATDTTFLPECATEEVAALLRPTRYVITLDADTIIPPGAARRLIGTLAHPLNQAVFDDQDRVVSGYTVLQPRMEVHPGSVGLSWFTRIYTGGRGLDLYTHAVSDVYQDLFGEGIFVGKGIYDVDAFERSVHNRIPENALLSHDLLEGSLGRAGLVTDVTMVEDYPPSYFATTRRQHRWIRGDWQLLPWLLTPSRFNCQLSAIDRWKVIHNLLRSVISPAMILLLAATAGMRGYPWLWILAIAMAYGVPLATSMRVGLARAIRGQAWKFDWGALGRQAARLALAVAFLPYDTYVACQAILVTLHRLLVSHRYLLTWITAQQAARDSTRQRRRDLRVMFAAAALATLLVIGVGLLALPADASLSRLLWIAPLALLWLSGPALVQVLDRPVVERVESPSEAELAQLRRLGRHTWNYFLQFVGPQDHWLPPDHFQETPIEIVAHHTSPSNIGLYLTSALAAYDLGYLHQLGLAARLSATLETLTALPRYRGHLLNWYDTETLAPLHPRYVSTVDSGNLAASLIVIARAARTMDANPVLRWHAWQGYSDTLDELLEVILPGSDPHDALSHNIRDRVAALKREIQNAKSDPARWYALCDIACGDFWPLFSQDLADLIGSRALVLDRDALRHLQAIARQATWHHETVQTTLQEMVPWVFLLQAPPAILRRPPCDDRLTRLEELLVQNPELGQMRTIIAQGQGEVTALRQVMEARLADAADEREQAAAREALDWLSGLSETLDAAATRSEQLRAQYEQIAAQAEALVDEMDFGFLYHPQRRVFHIGYNMDTGQLDNNYYDLLASEARIASLIAIAQGQVPPTHWLQLGRPLTRVEGVLTLLSWSATMFEYLMPPLYLDTGPGTLLQASAEGAVRHQIAYGRAHGTPWGISESGYYLFDANQNYQYRAFGVPGLGFKRGLADDHVIAPYASLLALRYAPVEVVRNLADLRRHQAEGLYGLYEALDFTPDRLPSDQPYAVVREYMAHHQGMILMSLVNYLNGNVMVERMHSDPRIESVELLLQEQVPVTAPLQHPESQSIEGTARAAVQIVDIASWQEPLQAETPRVNLLSNGDYAVMASSRGGGYSTWKGVDLTRWRSDGTLDPWGTWVYLQEVSEGAPRTASAPQYSAPWPATYLPIPDSVENVQTATFAHMSVYRRMQHGISATTELTISPDAPVEVRRVHLINDQGRARVLRLTSYGEVVLGAQAGDMRHPAYSKMFVESGYVPELHLQVFSRRGHGNEDQPAVMGHMLVVREHDDVTDPAAPVRHESDRMAFVGRGRTLRDPAALSSPDYLTGTTGMTLDPIYSLGTEIAIPAHGSRELAYLTLAAPDRPTLLSLARQYRQWEAIERTFHEANTAALTWLGRRDMHTEDLRAALAAASALLYSDPERRSKAATLAANHLSQAGLWRLSISGDYPIILVEVEDAEQGDLVSQAVRMHELLAARQLKADLVILNRQPGSYAGALTDAIRSRIAREGAELRLNQRGGIFVLSLDQLQAEEIVLLRSAAGIVLQGERGALYEQLNTQPAPRTPLPALMPTQPPRRDLSDPEWPEPLALTHENGYGGFSEDGREYVIDLPSGQMTPAPWSNIIGYPEFGFMATESGSQTTWAVNSGENRLTPWSNDPVTDPTGEALYLRDEETAEIWSPTVLPAGAPVPHRIRHGAGYTLYESASHGLRQELAVYASPEDPVKLVRLRVENRMDVPRRLTATQYVEWVLGTVPHTTRRYLIPAFDAETACLTVRNPYHMELGERTAFMVASRPLHGYTADRAAFLGMGGSLARPAALGTVGLEPRVAPGGDVCGALQVHLDLAPHASDELYFVIGQGADPDHAAALAQRYRQPEAARAAWEDTQRYWDDLLGRIQVRTPEPAIDPMLNRWLLYQSLSCRLYGRSAFYQSSGAFGFRDQLQDALAWLAIEPAIARDQILNAAARQFEEGDVLHWWHPPSGRGVRTRIADNLLWLPYVAAHYVRVTGDSAILDEPVPFLSAPPLEPRERERYGEYARSAHTAPLREHCLRAIEKGSTRGPHGLPLIGAGDWNDGMNRVGLEGQGESVWLGWFLVDVLQRWAGILEELGNAPRAQSFRQRAADYTAALEKAGWDGAWYTRAFYDDGTPLGAANGDEPRIDAIAQSWAVLSGAGDPAHSRAAMAAVGERLVHPDERLSLLFTPPFDGTGHDPGYISDYPPGIRENGGQYTHAATWTAWAFAALGDGERAAALLEMLCPVGYSDSPEAIERYRVEPYVIAADVYSQPPYVGRGGWTWYTGSAGWAWRLGIEGVLGLHKEADTLRIAPAIPPAWDGYEIRYRHGEALYIIRVANPEHVAGGVREITLDGEPLPSAVIPLRDDGREHTVEVVLGG